ncbi:MAG: hypothetical protein DRN57_05515 [Thermoplasmata archaeon]|nr:MAG: hypothetical protein DRN57_05515 [Thermoplasmata archaeon]
MEDFHQWIVKLYLNLDEGNLKEALYCSDMALYTAEDPHGETPEEELTRLYSLRARIRELMGKK